MGGCASKPNEADGPNPENSSPKSTAAHELTTKLPDDGDVPAEVKTEKAEEPLVDTPKVDEDNSSTTVNAEEIAAEIKELKTESVEPTGSVTEAEKEEKVEVDKVATKETDKKEEVVDQPLVT